MAEGPPPSDGTDAAPPSATEVRVDGVQGKGRVSFFAAFLSSALGTAVSRVLGAVRDVATAAVLGAGNQSDAFLTAFMIPGVFRRFVADEGLTGALIPALAETERRDGEEETRKLAANVLGVLLVLNVVIVLLGWLLAEPIVLAFVYSWKDDPEKPLALTVQLTRWMFPFLTMVSLVSFFEGLLNYRGHFFTPKVAPGLVSAGIAIGALGFATRFEEPVFALAIGTLVGGLAHVLVNLPALWSRWGPVRVGFAWRDPRVRSVLWELGKVILIGLFAQVNILVLRQLAATLESGSITHYHNATRVSDLAQGVVAVAIGSALLPNVSAAVAARDGAQLRNDLVGAARLACFLLLPVAMTILLFAEPVTSLLFRRGAYLWADVLTTADALRFLIPYMLALAGLNILKKVFFALGDRRTLLLVGALGVALTGGVGWVLVDTLAVRGLTAALSIATSLQLALYVVVLRLRLGEDLGLAQLVRPVLEMFVCLVPVAAILGPAAWWGDWSTGADIGNLFLAGGALGLAAAAYLLSAQLIGLSEVRRVTGRLAARLGR